MNFFNGSLSSSRALNLKIGFVFTPIGKDTKLTFRRHEFVPKGGSQPGVSQNRNSNLPLFFILKRRACRRHRAPKLEFTFVSPLWREHTPFGLRISQGRLISGSFFLKRDPAGNNSNVPFFPQGQELRNWKLGLSPPVPSLAQGQEKGH